jgi:allantoinase
MRRTANAGVPLLVHAELAGPIEAAERAVQGKSRLSYLTYLASRPRTAEDEAIALMVKLCAETRAPVHIVHHASSTSLALLAAARDDGLPITVETCPHYLHFDAEAIPDGATQFKCAPPIRERENRDKLWELGLERGPIDMVVSDHSPCTPELKRGDFLSAWGGIASLQLTLPVMWTEAQRRGVGVQTLAEWMCRAPARLAGLHDRKGWIAPGRDADLVVWEPETGFTVNGARLLFRHALTPYDGELLYGRVVKTMLRGEIIYDAGSMSETPRGRLLTRS